MIRTIFLAIFSITAAGLPIAATLQESDQEKDDRIAVPEDENTIARRDFMRTKLMYSQNMLEGLTLGDFAQIDGAIEDMKQVTKGSAWVSIDNDQYRKLTADFETALERLERSADSENVEATSLRFYQMSTSCIDCHQHIRKVGYTF